MKIIDLTRKIAPNMNVFPGSPQPCFVPWTNFSIHGYDSEAIFMSTHTGTHIDAPSHFIPGKRSIDDISASRFVADALLVKVPKKADQLVEAGEIKGHGIKQGDAVVLATGWEKKAGARNYMSANPGLSAGAARYLAGRRVSIVAIDGPSIDRGSDFTFAAHRILLAKNVLAVENLCNLDRISKVRFRLVVAPLKLSGSTGSPVRALALL